MAWRPYEYLVGGEIEFKNNEANGYIYFLTLGIVKIKLRQNYIVSGKVKFEKTFTKIQEDMKYMIEQGGGRLGRVDYLNGFKKIQEGELGDFTTGKDDNPYADYFYFEWYSDNNGRIVYEGESEEVQILDPLVFNFPKNHQDQQQGHLDGFLSSVSRSIVSETKEKIIAIQFPSPNQESS